MCVERESGECDCDVCLSLCVCSCVHVDVCERARVSVRVVRVSVVSVYKYMECRHEQVRCMCVRAQACVWSCGVCVSTYIACVLCVDACIECRHEQVRAQHLRARLDQLVKRDHDDTDYTLTNTYDFYHSHHPDIFGPDLTDADTSAVNTPRRYAKEPSFSIGFAVFLFLSFFF